MIGKHPYGILIKYPHLRPHEVAIWERFIRKHPDFFDSIDYDVKVGTPREYPKVGMESVQKGMEELSRKRIDFVGYKGKQVFIGEIKPSASFSAIGQLLAEKSLYLEEHPEIKEVSLILVTDQVVPDMPKLCSEYGIQYFVV